MVALAILIMVLVFLTIDFIVQRATYRRALARAESRTPVPLPALHFAPQAPPRGLFLDPSHTWVRVGATGELDLGADALATTALGTPTSMNLLPPGTEFRRGEVLATLRRDGRALSLKAPVDGVVEDVNLEVADAPSELAAHPYDQGWLYRIRPRSLSPLKKMRIAEEAAEWIGAELHRLRETAARLAGPNQPVGATLLDGGLPIDGLASHLEPAAWDTLTAELFDPDRGATRPGDAIAQERSA